MTFLSPPVIFLIVKPVHLIAPAVALLIAGILVGGQRQKISRLEGESNLLRKHIAAEKSRIGSGSAAREPVRPSKPESTGDEIDWMEAAEVFGEMRNSGGVGDMRAMMSFQSKLQKMDSDQLLAALDQLQMLELGDEERMMLESTLVGQLAQKDPELVLNRFSDRLGDEGSGMGWQLASALGVWAKKDRTAAIAWFDKEIAAGTFDSKSLDGRSHIRLNFESHLAAQLISTDPAAAEARIAALPADQRKDALGFGSHNLKEEDQLAYAKLARATLSEEEQHEVFAQQASRIAMVGGLEKAGAYLDRIGVTGQERIEAAEQVASGKLSSGAFQSKVTVDEIDSIREWLGSEAPGSVDKVTGEALGQIVRQRGSTSFPEAAAMMLKYHEQGGSDDLLIGFVEKNRHGGNREEAREIAEKITDPQKREEVLEKLK